jgi:hypothetical protein
VSLSENVVPIAPSENHSISPAKHLQTKIVGARFFLFSFLLFFFNTLCVSCKGRRKEKHPEEEEEERDKKNAFGLLPTLNFSLRCVLSS